jgi:hypothetical protein
MGCRRVFVVGVVGLLDGKIEILCRLGGRKAHFNLEPSNVKQKGRKVIVNLIDGSSYGPRIVEVGNWVGMAFFCPKSRISETMHRTEWDNPGVYCLRYESTDGGTEKVYWGEAENIRIRLKEHLANPKMNQFTELVFFTSKDDWLTKTQIKYLEHRLVALSKDRGATLQNTATPSRPRIHETDENDMEYFLDQILMILPLMGFRFMIDQPSPSAMTMVQEFEIGKLVEDELEEQVDSLVSPLPPITPERKSISPTEKSDYETAAIERTPQEGGEVSKLIVPAEKKTRKKKTSSSFKRNEPVAPGDQVPPIVGLYRIVQSKAKATMDIVDGRYLVRKGSHASKVENPSLSPTYVALRKRLLETGILVDDGAFYSFATDCSFTSPSAAANVVRGAQSPGPRMWVDAENRSLRGIVNDDTSR